MITRIVKLEFQQERIEAFLSFFETIKDNVNNFPGCHGMQLLRDQVNPCIVFTYSQWDNEQDLENYRLSKTFGEIWPKIKPWFAKSAEAWSVEVVFDGFSVKKRN